MKGLFNILSMVFLYLAICFFCGCQGRKPDNLNNGASIMALGDLTENPLLLGVITTSVNLNGKTMSTLYGNKIAVNFAKKNSRKDYPTGAVLYEVTWAQQPDSVWFGAKIPSNLISVEKIKFMKEGEPFYTLFQGKPLKKSRNRKASDRILKIVSQRYAVVP